MAQSMGRPPRPSDTPRWLKNMSPAEVLEEEMKREKAAQAIALEKRNQELIARQKAERDFVCTEPYFLITENYIVNLVQKMNNFKKANPNYKLCSQDIVSETQNYALFEKVSPSKSTRMTVKD